MRKHFKVAFDLYEQKKYQDAIIEYSTYLSNHPEDEAAYYNRALAKYMLVDYKDAIRNGGIGSRDMQGKISRASKRRNDRQVDKRRRRKGKKQIDMDLMLFLGQWVDF